MGIFSFFSKVVEHQTVSPREWKNRYKLSGREIHTADNLPYVLGFRVFLPVLYVLDAIVVFFKSVYFKYPVKRQDKDMRYTPKYVFEQLMIKFVDIGLAFYVPIKNIKSQFGRLYSEFFTDSFFSEKKLMYRLPYRAVFFLVTSFMMLLKNMLWMTESVVVAVAYAVLDVGLFLPNLCRRWYIGFQRRVNGEDGKHWHKPVEEKREFMKSRNDFEIYAKQPLAELGDDVQTLRRKIFMETEVIEKLEIQAGFLNEEDKIRLETGICSKKDLELQYGIKIKNLASLCKSSKSYARQLFRTYFDLLFGFKYVNGSIEANALSREIKDGSVAKYKQRRVTFWSIDHIGFDNAVAARVFESDEYTNVLDEAETLNKCYGTVFKFSTLDGYAHRVGGGKNRNNFKEKCDAMIGPRLSHGG